jgi:hypothetical protein
VYLEWDSTQSLSSPAAWTFLDGSTIPHTGDNVPGGYQMGTIDKWGYMWFNPTHNFAPTGLPAMPPYLVYNTALPFGSTSSWKTYPFYGYNGTTVCALHTSACSNWSSGASSFNPTLNEWYGGGVYGEGTTPPENYNWVMRENAPAGYVPPSSGTALIMGGKISMTGKITW